MGWDEAFSGEGRAGSSDGDLSLGASPAVNSFFMARPVWVGFCLLIAQGILTASNLPQCHSEVSLAGLWPQTVRARA